MVAGITVTALLLAAVLVPVIPPNELSESKGFCCIHCGIRRYTKAKTTIDEPPQILEDGR